ncbi:farnesyltranstransferase [Trichosporon asahii var. asahii CBS 2479]|uniref:(2E,6E)-farnesyl diphosphate synthase n=1 Tax=Trichosporon asahii var. asahii (strain ATCC 90039 / CBS 2479 / JCM 2466 / KCTC 7840 / NBRC 103889/ NCYC 2677 / UAMH 7654) TaxID=1186058 RepID=J4UKT4_TRIAS|nr:farnesyltranstransferase [Trichosporon asahii var. asahii CBS 2479]EJT52485.1 farnesyltranstransferase [Trichosporon asahii var. asahii CBS 2479]
MDYSKLRSQLKQDSAQRWSEAQEKVLREPYEYICNIPGKEVRSRLIEAFNLWMGIEEKDLDTIRRVVTMLHNASLLMDDVEDDSELRRGVPVAHAIYGVPQTINTANYVYFLAFQELLKLRDENGTDDGGHDLASMVTDEMLSLHRGQGMELFWRDSLTCPTEEEYVQMVLGKTGGLFRIAVKLMMAKSKKPRVDYIPLADLISVFFQIRDDYMNLQSDQYADRKGFCEDLTEGKFSFPIVHGVRADTSNRQILNVLQKKTHSDSLKRHTVEYLKNTTKSFAYTRQVLDELKQQIELELKELGGNKGLDAIMAKLSYPESD